MCVSDTRTCVAADAYTKLLRQFFFAERVEFEVGKCVGKISDIQERVWKMGVGTYRYLDINLSGDYQLGIKYFRRYRTWKNVGCMNLPVLIFTREEVDLLSFSVVYLCKY